MLSRSAIASHGNVYGSLDGQLAGVAIRRRLLITHPTVANAAPSTSAAVAPSRPARPKQSAASAAPLVCPVRRAVATMPLALPLRSAGALDIRAFMFGAWKKPNPHPQIAIRQTMSATAGFAAIGSVMSFLRLIATPAPKA